MLMQPAALISSWNHFNWTFSDRLIFGHR